MNNSLHVFSSVNLVIVLLLIVILIITTCQVTFLVVFFYVSEQEVTAVCVSCMVLKAEIAFVHLLFFVGTARNTSLARIATCAIIVHRGRTLIW